MAHHYHVGFNLVGHVPGASDVQCVEDADDAVLALEDLLTERMDEWAERCDNFGNHPEWSVCSCAWCRLVEKVERYRDDTGDDAIEFRLRWYSRDGVTFVPPGGQPVVFWAKRQDGDQCAA
ncbi:hypothetical protein GCM10010331_44510 [Streptomyces xanthochromogenes]|uniref:hypothetical protein n=1 Tax=Streptomyces xanthochromogenes TaxID=67384 RepID=UPI001677C7E4|nr:hypothetical protein [Streptomyces xanthochromogenes]GHB52048.1 hypothetical protein GCM10010331_44510 [Streptomyces xanthochromogenes]